MASYFSFDLSTLKSPVLLYLPPKETSLMFGKVTGLTKALRLNSRHIWLWFKLPINRSLHCKHEIFFKQLFKKKFFFSYLTALGLSCSMWDLVPWPGIKPTSHALWAGFLTPGPSGKSCVLTLFSPCGRTTLRAQGGWISAVCCHLPAWWASQVAQW